MICFKYRWPDYTGPTLEWCTPSSDPTPPPPPGPGPAPPGWPDDYGDEVTMRIESTDGPGCWAPEVIAGVEYDPDIGPWGGYGATYDGFGVGDLALSVYPISWSPGVVTWRFEWDVFGGTDGLRDVDQAAGFFPGVILEDGEIVDCPLRTYQLSIYIPP